MKFIYAFIITLVSSQMVPVPQPEEDLKVNFKEQEIKFEPQQFLHTAQIFSVDQESYQVLLQKFQNTVLLIHDSQNEKSQLKLLNITRQQLKPEENKIDVIFLHANQSTFPSLKLGLHLSHFGSEYHTEQNSEYYSFIKNIVTPPLERLDENQVDSYLQGNSTKALLVMKQNHQFYELVKHNFEELLKNNKITEAGISDIRVVEEHPKIEQPKLVLYKPGHELEYYDNNITYADQIEDFLYLESLPNVVPLRDEYLARVFGGPINSQMHLLMNKWDDNLLEVYREGADYNKQEDLKYERIIFTYSKYEDNKDLFDQFDLNENSENQIVLTRSNFRKFQLEKYLYNQDEITKEKINQFIEDFRNRNVEQYFKSEAILENQNEVKNIVKVVGKSFTEEVLKGRKNVLILFWDSKDKSDMRHENLLKQLIEEMKEAQFEYLKVAQIDMAINEHEKIAIDRAPIMYLYLSGDRRHPKEYRQDLVIEQLKSWLQYWISDLNIYKNDL